MNAFTTIAFGCTPTGISVSSEYSVGLQCARLALLDYGHVAGLRVEYQQIVLIRGEREAVRTATHRQRRQALAHINVIDRNAVGAEVRHVETRVVERDHAAGWMLADLLAAADFVVAGLDDRDAVGVEVADDQFAAVRLECEAHWRATHVEQREDAVVFLVAALWRRRFLVQSRRLATIRSKRRRPCSSPAGSRSLPVAGKPASVARTRKALASIRDTVLSRDCLRRRLRRPGKCAPAPAQRPRAHCRSPAAFRDRSR